MIKEYTGVQIFNKIQLQEDENVLELGCGTGKLWLDI